MTAAEHPKWNKLYSAAILNPKKLAGRIDSAEKAIRERLTELEEFGGEPAEQKLMYDSLQTLSNLRRLGPRKTAGA